MNTKPAVRLGLASALSAAFVCCSDAGPFADVLVENAFNMSYVFVHGAVDTDDSHPRAFGAFWPSAITVTDDNGVVTSDSVSLSGNSVHAIPPHGEGPNPNNRVWGDNISAGSFGGGRTVHTASFAIMEHGPHWNRYYSVYTVNVDDGILLNDFLAYTLQLIGKHDDKYVWQPEWVYSGTLSGQNEVPPTPSEAFGSVFVLVDPVTGEMRLDVVVAGLDRSKITAAHIHQGAPGQNGPPIYDLGDGSRWQAVGTMGSHLAHFNGNALGQVMTALKTGTAYVNVHSLSFPSGEVRAQLAWKRPRLAK